ncbi:MAG: FAD-dependent oxidoreductase [Spirochaetaceae bacterium]|nr:MAG: FAD-dependent oxidoreductase [Spirochaetaceae bacterium]
MKLYREPARDIPVSEYDVVVVGAGTGGVIAAVAAARNGARTAIIEAKGYPGGTAVEGGTVLHSFYNLWKAFPGVEKRRVVRGIPLEMVERLIRADGCSGFPEMEKGYDYDSVCTAIDTEVYKHVAYDFLADAGIDLRFNTFMVDAVRDGDELKGVITENRGRREALMASSFVDATGYGDLCARAGAAFSEPNDHPVANSMGVGGVNMDTYYDFMNASGAVQDLCRGRRSGRDGQVIRVTGSGKKLPAGFVRDAEKIGMSTMTTTLHDNYFMFVKVNFKMPKSPTDPTAIVAAERELRRRQVKAIEVFRKHIPGFEKAFIARTSPTLCIRRGRCITCDYDITIDDVVDGKHFADEVFVYGFHDCAPRIKIKNGGTYGTPYQALLVTGLRNLYATGMMITSDWEAHMSTRNTVSCMGHGQAAGTAAAICAERGIGSRELPYADLRRALEAGGVYFEA